MISLPVLLDAIEILNESANARKSSLLKFRYGWLLVWVVMRANFYESCLPRFDSQRTMLIKQSIPPKTWKPLLSEYVPTSKAKIPATNSAKICDLWRFELIKILLDKLKLWCRIQVPNVWIMRQPPRQHQFTQLSGRLESSPDLMDSKLLAYCDSLVLNRCLIGQCRMQSLLVIKREIVF